MKPFAITLKDFSGGLNLKYDDNLLALNEAKDLRNCDPYSKGWIDRRKGCTMFTSDGVSTETNIDNLIRFYPDASTSILVASTNNATANKLWSFNDSTGAETEITGGTALAANTRIRFSIYKEYLLLTDGVAPIQYWSGSSTKGDIAGTPTPPTGKYLATHKRRVYVAGNATNPSSLYYSDLGLYTSTGPGTDCVFQADSVEPIGDETRAITGIIPQQDHLVIFKDNTFHKWIGIADYEFRVLDTNRPYGCVAPDSIAMCEGWVVFLSHDGIRAYDGGLHCILLSDKITPIIDGSSSDKGIDQDSKHLCRAVYHDGLYRLSYHGHNALYQNKEIVFNFRNWIESNGQKFNWYYNTGRNIGCYCVYTKSSDENKLMAGDSNAPYIYRLEQGYSDYVYGYAAGGNVIDMLYQTKAIDKFSEEISSHAIKKFRKFKASTYLQAGSFAMGFDVDQKRVINKTVTTGSGVYWNSFYWNAEYWASSVLKHIHIGLSGASVGEAMSVSMRENSGKAESKIFNMEIYGKAKEYK